MESRPDWQPTTETVTRPAAQDRTLLRESSFSGALVANTGNQSRWRQRMRRSDLFKRAMGLDALECPRCRGRLEPIAEILDPGAAGKILRFMGLPDTPPRLAPARSPPQQDFDFAQEG
jgi:hypothetical protein